MRDDERKRKGERKPLLADDKATRRALDGSRLRRGILRSGSATGVAIADVPRP